jgi:hypothetical protein
MYTEENIRVLQENTAAVTSLSAKMDILRNGIHAELIRCIKSTGSDCNPKDAYANVISPDLCSADFAHFCYRCTQELTSCAAIENLLPESDWIDDDILDTGIAYQQNMYADRAFASFSNAMANASAHYFPSLAAVCEEVYYGRCGYCLLPIYSSEDGILTAFTRMITKYDLKIDRTCDVLVRDGDAIIRFALLRRGLNIPASDPCYVQINAVLPESVRIGSFLAACEAVGASTMELVTMPLSYTNDSISYTIRFRIPSSLLAAILLFLQAVLDNYSLEGIFTMIHEK